MQRKFLINLGFLLFLNFLIKPFYILGIDAEMINAVGTESYGTYFAVFNFSYLLQIILDLGINSYNTQHISRHHSLMGKYFSHLIGVKLMLVLVYLMFTLGLGLLWGYQELELKMLLWLGINQSLMALILYLRSNIAGLQIFWLDSVISVLDKLLLIFFAAYLLWGEAFPKPLDIMWFIYAQTLAFGTSFLFALFWVWKKSAFVLPRWNKLITLAILKKSYPFALLVLLMTFYYKSDTIMLEKMLPDGTLQSGYYAQAYRFFEAGNMVAYLFATLLLPMFSKLLAKNESIHSLVKISFQVLFPISILVATAALFFGNEIMQWKYEDLHEHSSHILAVLMFCFVFISTTYIFGTLLTANGNVKLLNILSLSALVINIVLNLICIPKWQALGSAIASLITQIFVSVVQIIFSLKHFKIEVSLAYYFRIITFVLVVLAFGFLSTSLSSLWLLNLSIFLGVSLFLAYATKAIPFKNMLDIVKDRSS
ncbi:MAG: oligosaccharide flippase family protein [Flavobacteriales bacterium]|jgi:O-antigen/teichoic acid export membrane protein|nr:oligosaccharide flippase family protein [Flavobacteriales bacterium]